MTCFTPSDALGAPKVKLRKALARAAGMIASLRFGASKSEGVTFSFLNQKRPYLLAWFLRPANSTPTRSSVNFLMMPSFPVYLPPYSSPDLMLTIVSMGDHIFSPFKYNGYFLSIRLAFLSSYSACSIRTIPSGPSLKYPFRSTTSPLGRISWR